MRWLGYKRVALKSIVVDAEDIRARTKAAHVAELAATIRSHGGDGSDKDTINPLTVREDGALHLICGRDRFAALLTLKTRRVWVHLCECTDAEAADLEAIENVHRRADNRAEILARAVAAKEAMFAERNPAEPAEMTRRAGVTVSRPAGQAIRAEARRQVARAAGVSTGAVRQAQARAAAKRERSEDVARSGHGAAGDPPTGSSDPDETPGPGSNLPAAAPEPPCIDLLGTPREHAEAAGTLAECAAIQAAIDEADKHLRLAQAALKRLETTAFPADQLRELRDDVHRVASRVRSERPGSICPWCKGLAQQIRECGGCNGDRWVSAERAKLAPEECRGPGALVVVVDGAMRSYIDTSREAYRPRMRPATLPEPPKKKTKPRLTIEMPDGTPFSDDGAPPREITVERDE